MSDNYIQITKLNDFYFCPASLFLRTIYNNYEEVTFYGSKVYGGKLAHKSIDNSNYSSKKNILQNLPVYSQKYNLVGKADIVDLDKLILIERKTKIKKVYKGHLYQLYAIYFCLLERGVKVNSLVIRSLQDNKIFKFKVPNKKDEIEFEAFVNEVKNFNLNNFVQPSIEKCNMCIYKTLCPYTNVE